MRKYIMGLVLFCIMLIGVNMSMTFVVVELSKETHTDGDTGIMKTKAGNVVKVEAVESSAPMSSRLSDTAFHSMTRFDVQNGANYLSLRVHGWARIFSKVERCKLPEPKPVLKARMVSALESMI